MAFKAIYLRIDQASRVSLKLGYRTAQILLEIPTKQLAVQAVRAAFGKKARIVGGRKP